jgi:hypothetical protein
MHQVWDNHHYRFLFIPFHHLPTPQYTDASPEKFQAVEIQAFTCLLLTACKTFQLIALPARLLLNATFSCILP